MSGVPDISEAVFKPWDDTEPQAAPVVPGVSHEPKVIPATKRKLDEADLQFVKEWTAIQEQKGLSGRVASSIEQVASVEPSHQVEEEKVGSESLANLREAAQAAANSVFSLMLSSSTTPGASIETLAADTTDGTAQLAVMQQAQAMLTEAAATFGAPLPAAAAAALLGTPKPPPKVVPRRYPSSAADGTQGPGQGKGAPGRIPLAGKKANVQWKPIPIGNLIRLERKQQQERERLQKEAQEQEAIQALAVAQQVAAGQGLPVPTELADLAGQVAGQMYVLAQVAEEATHTAAQAAAYCANPEVEPSQVQTLAQTALEASQRATWAMQAFATCFPKDDCAGADKEEWTANVRQIIKQAAEAAEMASTNCQVQAVELIAKVDTVQPAGKRMKGDGKSKRPMNPQDVKAKVPCKWFLSGACRKGSTCEFSHELQDTAPRPLQKKRAELCQYFQKGQCTRGQACPFAHGEEELAEVAKLVSELKTEKKWVMRLPGDWICPGCGENVFAFKDACYNCGEKRGARGL